MGESPTLAFAKKESCLALFGSGQANPSASGCTTCGAPLTIYGAGNSLSSSALGLYEKGAGSGFDGGGLAAAFGGAEGGAFPGYRSCVACVAGGGGAGLGGELTGPPETTPAGAPGGGNLPLGALNGGNLPLGAPGGGDFAIDALGDGNFGIGRGHG